MQVSQFKGSQYHVDEDRNYPIYRASPTYIDTERVLEVKVNQDAEIHKTKASEHDRAAPCKLFAHWVLAHPCGV